MRVPDRGALVDGGGAPSIRKQCELLGLARSGVYRKAASRPLRQAQETTICFDAAARRAVHGLAVPRLAGRMAAMLRAQGQAINRKYGQRPMRKMGEAGQRFQRA
ncbi:MAG: hypothetical protein ACRECN_02835 [Methylocella sp.]